MRILRFFRHDFEFSGRRYGLDGVTGSLFQRPAGLRRMQSYPQKITVALEQCNDPFLLSQIDVGQRIGGRPGDERLKVVLRRMIALCEKSFLMGRLYASARLSVFEDAGQAISWFNAHTPNNLQEELCLPRAMFAAKTSACFPSEGVVFIGTLLPTSQMHAWVIENGRQPDVQDRHWVTYRPVASLG